MILMIKELCLVENDEMDGEETTTGVRTVIYETKADNFAEAVMEYENSFDSDNMHSSGDDFMGGCLDTISILSVEVLQEEE